MDHKTIRKGNASICNLFRIAKNHVNHIFCRKGAYYKQKGVMTFMKILFLNQESYVEADFHLISEHVVQLSGVDKNLSGFHILNDKDTTKVLGKYEGFKTLYRELENAYQLSDDGSVYVAPPEPEPYEPTLEEVQEAKVAEMNAAQQSIIAGGCEVELTDGTKNIFTAADQDQLSLNGLSVNALKKTIESMVSGINSEGTATQSDPSKLFPWHTADESEPCKFYSQEDSEKITNTVMAFVVYHVTYFRDLRIYIRSLTDKEAVEAITYGTPIPEAYQSEVLKSLLAAETAGGSAS